MVNDAGGIKSLGGAKLNLIISDVQSDTTVTRTETDRLITGNKLSVVIRAASSQTLGSIEGARDAIADRMAAIGQPLDSLVFKQTGANTDGNANGNASSADGGSAGGEQRSAQGAGERGGSNDALSRRGAGRDRSF